MRYYFTSKEKNHVYRIFKLSKNKIKPQDDMIIGGDFELKKEAKQALERFFDCVPYDQSNKFVILEVFTNKGTYD